MTFHSFRFQENEIEKERKRDWTESKEILLSLLTSSSFLVSNICDWIEDKEKNLIISWRFDAGCTAFNLKVSSLESSSKILRKNLKPDDRFISWASFIESLLFDLENFQIHGLGKVGKHSFRSERGKNHENLPQKARVAKRLLSIGGAQCRHIPWHAGYVTPWYRKFIQCYIHCHTHDEHRYMHTHENGAKLWKNRSKNENRIEGNEE